MKYVRTPINQPFPQVPSKKQILWVTTYVFFVSVLVLALDSSVIKALLFTSFISILIGFGGMLGFGRAIRFSRGFLLHGMDLASRAEFKEARRYVLAATRADRGLLQVKAVHRLYDRILAEDNSAEAIQEIELMKKEMSGWQTTKIKALYLSPEFGAFLTFTGIAFLCARLFSRR